MKGWKLCTLLLTVVYKNCSNKLCISKTVSPFQYCIITKKTANDRPPIYLLFLTCCSALTGGRAYRVIGKMYLIAE